MRAPFTTAALGLLLLSWLLNQYPLWGAHDPGPANDWGVAYMFAAGAMVLAAAVLFWRRQHDAGTGAMALAAGFYANVFMMELAKQGEEAIYAVAQALVAALVLVCVVLVQRPGLEAATHTD